MEFWDLFDRSGALTKTDHIRGEAIPQGMYHKIISVIVQHVDGDYLVMTRSENKAGRPGEYELSAGGSSIKGEDFEEAARRELREETGIVADKLYALTPEFVREDGPFLQKNFYCLVEIDKDAIRLQEGETQAFTWMSEEAVLAIAHKDSLVQLTPKVIEKINAIKENDIK